MLKSSDLSGPVHRDRRTVAEARLREAEEEIARIEAERERLSPANVKRLRAEVEAEQSAAAGKLEAERAEFARVFAEYESARASALEAVQAAAPVVEEAVTLRRQLSLAQGKAIRGDYARPLPPFAATETDTVGRLRTACGADF